MISIRVHGEPRKNHRHTSLEFTPTANYIDVCEKSLDFRGALPISTRNQFPRLFLIKREKNSNAIMLYIRTPTLRRYKYYVSNKGLIFFLILYKSMLFLMLSTLCKLFSILSIKSSHLTQGIYENSPISGGVI